MDNKVKVYEVLKKYTMVIVLVAVSGTFRRKHGRKNAPSPERK